MNREDVLSHEIINAAIEVHRNTGPGMLESVYEQRLCIRTEEKESWF